MACTSVYAEAYASHRSISKKSGVFQQNWSKAVLCGRGQFESPTPSKNDESGPEQVSGAIVAAPPSSFKLVPIPSNSFQTVRGHLRARRAVSSDRLPLIPSLQNLHFASLKARLCRLGTGSEPFRTVWNRLEMAVPKHPKRALDLQRRPNQAGLFVSLDVFDSVQDLAHDLQVGRPFANRTPALQA